VYTYEWTMALVADAAKKPFIVLDRPNPVRGDRVEGGVLDPKYRSFVGQYPVALRYGLTPGELALYLAGTQQIRAKVTVVPMKGYRRSTWWDETGLGWVNPSPNIRNVDAALLYPGMSFFEATNVSEGRGTASPFHFVGAAWLTDAPAIARAMNLRKLPGVRFESTRQRIARGEKFGGQTIPMVRIIITSRDDVRSAEIGAHLLREIYIRHRKEFRWQEIGIERLSGSRALRNAVERGGLASVLTQWKRESAQFRARTAPYLLYRP
jgi:uncharacterized protein YbbC (DUF1343 family)